MSKTFKVKCGAELDANGKQIPDPECKGKLSVEEINEDGQTTTGPPETINEEAYNSINDTDKDKKWKKIEEDGKPIMYQKIEGHGGKRRSRKRRSSKKKRKNKKSKKSRKAKKSRKSRK